ncbi:MAG: hypothetical protein CFE26_03280 [Verrucomicrobiales bacterium VVV1]|nr:MAG: hypothetical protein CFE26_03280 [Verrucomicrobiales bacterium VVV1]
MKRPILAITLVAAIIAPIMAVPVANQYLNNKRNQIGLGDLGWLLENATSDYHEVTGAYPNSLDDVTSKNKGADFSRLKDMAHFTPNSDPVLVITYETNRSELRRDGQRWIKDLEK